MYRDLRCHVGSGFLNYINGYVTKAREERRGEERREGVELVPTATVRSVRSLSLV